MISKNTDVFTFYIKNRQIADNETEIIEEKGLGSCRIKNNKIYLIYKTEYDEEMQTTTVITDMDSVHIKRSGSVKSDIRYVLGKKTFSKYYMPYGVIDMEVKTERILNELSEDGGRLRIVYTLEMQSVSYLNDIEIFVKKL